MFTPARMGVRRPRKYAASHFIGCGRLNRCKPVRSKRPSVWGASETNMGGRLGARLYIIERPTCWRGSCAKKKWRDRQSSAEDGRFGGGTRFSMRGGVRRFDRAGPRLVAPGGRRSSERSRGLTLPKTRLRRLECEAAHFEVDRRTPFSGRAEGGQRASVCTFHSHPACTNIYNTSARKTSVALLLLVAHFENVNLLVLL